MKFNLIYFYFLNNLKNMNLFGLKAILKNFNNYQTNKVALTNIKELLSYFNSYLILKTNLKKRK